LGFGVGSHVICLFSVIWYRIVLSFGFCSISYAVIVHDLPSVLQHFMLGHHKDHLMCKN